MWRHIGSCVWHHALVNVLFTCTLCSVNVWLVNDLYLIYLCFMYSKSTVYVWLMCNLFGLHVVCMQLVCGLYTLDVQFMLYV